MIQSILESTKKVLGIDASYTVFDEDVGMHINTALSKLHQLGVGPDEAFEITGSTEVWSDFIETDARFSPVKTYVYLSVRLVFDPPTTSFALNAMKEQLQELEWRLNVTREAIDHPIGIEDDAVASSEAIDKLAEALSETFVVTVEAGTDLSTPRPANAKVVYWKFSAGVDIGQSGVNIVNAVPGDVFFVDPE